MLHPSASAPDQEALPVVARAVWRARWAILAAALVAALGGYLLSSQQSDVYTATGRVVLTSSQDFDPLGNQPYGDPSRFVANQVAIFGTQPVLDLALTQLGDGTTVQQLADSLDVNGSSEDDVVTVAATADSADEAAQRANAVIVAYQQYTTQRVADEAARAIAATTTPAVADQIQTQAAVYGAGVDVVEQALPPAAPSAPTPLRDGAILAGVAALVVCALALARRSSPGRQDRPTRSGGGRQLGTMPVRAPGGREQGAEVPEHSMVLVAVDYARRETPGPVLLTGVSADSGAAAVAWGLAASAAGQGRRVLLVDADPARRDLLARVGRSEPARRLDELAGAEASEVVQPLRLTAQPGGGACSLAVLGSPDAPMRLDHENLTKALSQLAGDYDLVLVQSAPITDSPLAYALVGHVGGVVVAVGSRDSADEAAALERVESAQRPVIGVIRTEPARPGRQTPAPSAQHTSAEKKKLGAQPV